MDYAWYPLPELVAIKKVAHRYTAVDQMRSFCNQVGIPIHYEDGIEGGMVRDTPGHGAKKVRLGAKDSAAMEQNTGMENKAQAKAAYAQKG